MKLFKHLAAASVTVGVAVIFTMGGISRADKSPATAPSTQPVNKMCAVEREEKVNPEITLLYDGKLIGFCCKDCIAKFKSNPEKYAKDLK